MKPVYVVDTNILYNWALDGSNHGRHDPGARWIPICADFCQDPNNDIFIPGLVWAELHGLALQKDLDLADLERCMRDRRALLQKIWREVYRADARIRLVRDPFDPTLAERLCRLDPTPEMLQALERQQIKGRADGRNSRAKLLDGVDSAILASAISIAQEVRPRPVRLVTLDVGLGLVNDHLARSRTALPDLTIPANLGFRLFLGNWRSGGAGDRRGWT